MEGRFSWPMFEVVGELTELLKETEPRDLDMLLILQRKDKKKMEDVQDLLRRSDVVRFFIIIQCACGSDV